MGINALVVGVGKFGINHARILAQINRKHTGTPSIDTLILAHVSKGEADSQAGKIKAETGSNVNIIGIEIRDERDLSDALREYRPGFTSITARDPIIGDRVHPLYVYMALVYGTVLCEKPFDNAYGDGTSLFGHGELSKYGIHELLTRTGHTFGLELPFAVVAQQMMENEYIKDKFQRAKEIEFWWITNGSGTSIDGARGTSIIDNLALHPWSFLPRYWRTIAIRGYEAESLASIDLIMYNPESRHSIKCRINLGYDGNFTAMRIDDCFIGIKREGPLNSVMQLDMGLSEAERIGNKDMEGNQMIIVDNPLKQNIIAALQGHPIVDPIQAFQSQYFLERVHGYKVPIQVRRQIPIMLYPAST